MTDMSKEDAAARRRDRINKLERVHIPYATTGGQDAHVARVIQRAKDRTSSEE